MVDILEPSGTEYREPTGSGFVYVVVRQFVQGCAPPDADQRAVAMVRRARTPTGPLTRSAHA